MKRIKLTEAQVQMLQLNEGRIDIEQTIEPEVNEINVALTDIASRLKNMNIVRIVENRSVLKDMADNLDLLDDKIYKLSSKVDAYNDDAQYGNIDVYIVKTLNTLEFKCREMNRVARAYYKLSEESTFMNKPEIFDKLFK